MGEDDDDEEDIGKQPKIQKNAGGLDYDSDEDKDGSELISLDSSNRDRTNTAADNIPKLQKPL